MGLRFELKEGDRTIAVYTKTDVVGRMLDAIQPEEGKSAASQIVVHRKKRKGRKGKGDKEGPANPELVE